MQNHFQKEKTRQKKESTKREVHKWGVIYGWLFSTALHHRKLLGTRQTSASQKINIVSNGSASIFLCQHPSI